MRGTFIPYDAIVVMGVSGCGKSSFGRLLADGLGWPFLEGDAFHPPENVARMAAGIPLTDEDRWGWLDSIAARIAEARQTATPVVVSCSALKRRYRDRLRTASDRLLFVHLAGDRDTILHRMSRRTGHYMPVSLLDSQFAALEPPQLDENAVTCGIEAPTEESVTRLLAQLSSASAVKP